MKGLDIAHGVVVTAAGILVVVAVVLVAKVSSPLFSTPTLTQESPDWVPSVPGSTNQIVLPGQCGQWNGQGWHRIECPKVQP